MQMADTVTTTATYDGDFVTGMDVIMGSLDVGAIPLSAPATEEQKKKLAEVWDELYKVDVSDYTETKNNLTYLPWSDAMTEVYKRYPDMEYNILWFDGDPYLYREGLGYMVFTTVTIEGKTKIMWLPVLDYRNQILKNPTWYEINKSLMRCLVKNFAAFGLGMYIYKKDSLPEDALEAQKQEAAAAQELEAKRKEITELGKDAIGKKKITGPKLRELITSLNPAGGAPGDIEDVETAEAVIAAIKKLKAPPKKKEEVSDEK